MQKKATSQPVSVTFNIILSIIRPLFILPYKLKNQFKQKKIKNNRSHVNPPINQVTVMTFNPR